MSNKSKLIAIAAIVLIAVSGFTAFAQDTDTTDGPPFGIMAHGGQGMMMGLGPRFAWDEDTAPMFGAIAEALDIDQETLFAQLQSGKTIAELAQEAGIDLEALRTATHTRAQEHVQALVDAGQLTQEQAQLRLNMMESHWENMPLFSGQGYRQGYGTMRGGMWGNNDTPARGPMGRWH